MASLFTTFFTKSNVKAQEQEWIPLYIPISPRTVPKNQIDDTVKSWLHPELGSVKAYRHLEQAIKSQELCAKSERYPHTEALRIVVELNVLGSQVTSQQDVAYVDLSQSKSIHVINAHVTAQYAAGYMDNDILPEDKPYNGTVHEVIKLTQREKLAPNSLFILKG